jgi:hypothetical protein
MSRTYILHCRYPLIDTIVVLVPVASVPGPVLTQRLVGRLPAGLDRSFGP